MGKFKGFRPRSTDSVCKRAAVALAWLLKKHRRDVSRAFSTWAELLGAVDGVESSGVDPSDVLARLRSHGTKVKIILREMGYGWCTHPADRSMIRATWPGVDTAVHCHPIYRRRRIAAVRNEMEWLDKTVGNTRLLHRSKEAAPFIDAINRDAPHLRGLVRALGIEETSADEPARTRRAG